MKKNKTMTTVLMVVVIGLWVVVFYRIYKSFFSEKDLNIPVESTFIPKAIKKEEKTEFVLKANYTDPFLGRLFSRPDNFVPSEGGGTVSVKKAVKKKEEPPAPVDWSFISYYGLIKNPQGNKNIALVNIQGSDHMVSEGEIVKEVTFIKNFRDSIQVSFKGATTYLKKK